MEYSFYDFLKLIGSLGLFLYGMKINRCANHSPYPVLFSNDCNGCKFR